MILLINMKIISNFLQSFPTATIIYLMLVMFTDLKFDWLWFVFAIIIDLIDDVVGNI